MSADQPKGDVWESRVATGEWDQIADELNEYGGALLPQLLTPEEAVEIREMCSDDAGFRSTVNMGRYRFGERAQSRGTATLIPRGHGYLFTTRDRPVESKRGWSAAPVRHGVSAIRSGERHTLGLVFHDAG